MGFRAGGEVQLSPLNGRLDAGPDQLRRSGETAQRRSREPFRGTSPPRQASNSNTPLPGGFSKA